MSIATQQYQIEQEFQLCTVSQLEDFDSTEYTWTGRHLTSWEDNAGNSYIVDGTAQFSAHRTSISGDWVLDYHTVSAYMPSGHGKVKVTVFNNERPLPSPVSKSVDLIDSQQTKMFYDSYLSIDCIPDVDYSAKFLRVNGEDKPVDVQYVHSGKTRSKDFIVSSDFFLDTGKAGLSVQAIGGNVYKFIYDDVPQPVQYRTSSTTVKYPFSSQSELTNYLSIASLSDVHGVVSAIGEYGFSSCKSLSAVHAQNIEYIGRYAFQQCESLSTIDLSNVVSVGDYAFSQCNSLTSICMPSLLSTDAAYAFSNCKNLLSVDFPNVKSIQSIQSSRYGNLFRDCQSLVYANLPECSSIGFAAFYGCLALSSIDINSTQAIGAYAFERCKSLKTIYVPQLKSTNTGVFQGCSSLVSIDLVDVNSFSSFEFKDCTSLSLVVGNKLKSIGTSSFENCISLSSICLSSLQTLGSNSFKCCSALADASIQSLTNFYSNSKDAFYGCNNLTSLYVDNSTWHSIENGYGDSNQTVVDDAEKTIIYGVQGIVNLSNSTVISVSDYAFAQHSKISSIDLPSITTIGSYAFKESSIQHLSCQNTQEIYSYAFASAVGPESLHLPQLSLLQSYAFQNNTGIQHIEMPILTSLGHNVFKNCTSLKTIDCENVKEMPGISTFEGCRNLVSAYLPNLTEIRGRYSYSSGSTGSFYNCTSLRSIDCSSVSSIWAYAFYNCEKLSSMNCPNVETIDLWAFANCSSLISLDFPCITAFGNYTFYNCTSLQSFCLSANSNVPSIETDAFDGIAHAVTVDIPYGKIDDYRADSSWNWLETNGKVQFSASVPTAVLIQEDGSKVMLTGKNLTQEMTSPYKSTTVSMTIGYPEGEQQDE